MLQNETQNINYNQEQLRVWHPKPLIRIAGIILMIIVGAIPAFWFCLTKILIPHSASSIYDWVIFISSVIFIPLLVLIMYFSCLKARLIVCKAGIIQLDLGFQIWAHWNELQSYDKVDIGNANYRIGFIVKQEASAVSGWLKGSYTSLPFLRILAALSGRYTPSAGNLNYTQVVEVSKFERRWESRELGALIKNYVPHFFDQETGKVISGEMLTPPEFTGGSDLDFPNLQTLKTALKEPLFWPLMGAIMGLNLVVFGLVLYYLP